MANHIRGVAAAEETGPETDLAAGSARSRLQAAALLRRLSAAVVAVEDGRVLEAVNAALTRADEAIQDRAMRSVGAPATSLGGQVPGDDFGPVYGSANPVAPPLAIAREGRRVIGTGMLSHVHEGPVGFAHGGISALLVDGVASLVDELTATRRVTRSMELSYRRPVPLAEMIRVEACCRSIDDRSAIVDATVALDADRRRTLVSAVVSFALLS